MRGRGTSQFYSEFITNENQTEGVADVKKRVGQCLNGYVGAKFKMRNDNQGRERYQLFCQFSQSGNSGDPSNIGRTKGRFCGDKAKYMRVDVTRWDDAYWSVRTSYPVKKTTAGAVAM